MPLPEAAVDHYQFMQRVQLAALGAARALWARMGNDFDASWEGVERQLVALVAASQMAAARSGAAYVPEALAQQAITAAALAEVDAAAFSGTASDGRPLQSLLYGAVTTAKTAATGGQGGQLALAAGLRWLESTLRTQVTDAARGAASAAITTHPGIGWTRMVNPPCCSRCAILAGKWFAYSRGFLRHPGCDCVHVPTRESVAGDVGVDVPALFASGKVRGLRRAQIDAISDGADPIQVVNADRSRRQQGMYTLEGTTKRGVANQARRAAGLQRANVRPTVDAIYRRASDREDALLLLTQNGYLRT